MDMLCSVRAELGASDIQHIRIQAVEDDYDQEDASCSEEEFETLRSRMPTNEAGQIVYGTITAWRFAVRDFVPWRISSSLLFEMDRWADAHAVGSKLSRISRQLEREYNQDLEIYGVGLIVTDVLHVEPAARGQDIGLCLLRELQRMHVGIPFYYAGETCALEIEDRRSPEFAAAKKALNRYYRSCGSLGLRAVAPRIMPDLLTAFWYGDVDPAEKYAIDLDGMVARSGDGTS